MLQTLNKYFNFPVTVDDVIAKKYQIFIIFLSLHLVEPQTALDWCHSRNCPVGALASRQFSFMQLFSEPVLRNTIWCRDQMLLAQVKQN